MMVSTRGRYALRVMLDLAEHGASGENIPMKDIAEREDLSLKYLEQIVPMLTKNGMIEGFHGKGGGYRLTRKPSEYTVDEIYATPKGRWLPLHVWTAVRRANAHRNVKLCPCGKSWTKW